MSERTNDPSLEDLLVRAAWARRLARHLARWQGDDDDLLQDAWVVAAEKAAQGERPSRPWLAGVLRVLGMNRARAAARRRERESIAGAEGEAQSTPGTAAPDDLIDRVQTQRRLSEALLALAEPYRTTVLLRYFEELSAAEIARRTRVPAGTVRWRLKEGLDRLRCALDERSGDRTRSTLALMAFARGPARPVMGKLALGAALTAATAGVVLVVAPPLERPMSRPSPVSQPSAKDDRMNRPMQTALGTLAAVASLAAAQNDASAAKPVTDLPPSKVPRYQVPLGVGPIRGPATAKVTVLAFMDYQSPFCQQASRTVESVLAAHAADVRYQIVHRPLPFHQQAPYATRAAFAAEQQGKFWQMHAALLANQTALSAADIERYARDIGLDLERFRADLAGPTVASKVELEEAAAQSVNITAVPTFFINGRTIGGSRPRAVFEQAIAEEIAYADLVLKAGVRPGDLYTTITARGSSELSRRRLDPPGQAIDPRMPEMPSFRDANKVLNENMALVNACYQEALALRPALAGRVVVDLVLDPGQRPAVFLHESTMNFPKVDNCIVKGLNKLSYPDAPGGRIKVRRVFELPPRT